MDTIFNTILPAIVGFFTSKLFVWIIYLIVSLAFGLMVYKYFKKYWVESQPNQWLLIIRNGSFYKAGVGLKTLITPFDSVVKFKSQVSKLNFNANNVTKEMQGVEITGFAFWSVFRDGQGPFKCYKYMQGGDANSNVSAMCESSLRNIIANSTLDEVLRNRDLIRQSIIKDVKKQLEGWGIWLESVQITQVRISSQKLFNDLQAEFRQATRLKADQIELNSTQKMTEIRQTSDLKMAQMNQTNATQKQVTKNNEQIKRRKQQSQFEDKKNELQIARLERQKRFEIERLKNDLQKEQQRIANNQKIESTKQAFDLEFSRKTIEMDRLHDQKTLQKYQIDVMERIYNKLGIKEIKINQFIGDGKANLASLLPSLGYGAAQLNSMG